MYDRNGPSHHGAKVRVRRLQQRSRPNCARSQNEPVRANYILLMVRLCGFWDWLANMPVWHRIKCAGFGRNGVSVCMCECVRALLNDISSVNEWHLGNSPKIHMGTG